MVQRQLRGNLSQTFVHAALLETAAGIGDAVPALRACLVAGAAGAFAESVWAMTLRRLRDAVLNTTNALALSAVACAVLRLQE